MARRLATFPRFTIQIWMSDSIYELVAGNRLWNTYARNALGDELLKHHRERIPKHFELGANQKYGYAARKESTKKKKRAYWKRNQDLDQVKTDRTRQVITANHRLAFSGSFGGPNSPNTLRGRLIMMRPRRLYQGRPGSISVEKLDEEITATTEAEQQEIAEGYRSRLIKQIHGYHGPLRIWRGRDRRYGSLRSTI